MTPPTTPDSLNKTLSAQTPSIGLQHSSFYLAIIADAVSLNIFSELFFLFGADGGRFVTNNSDCMRLLFDFIATTYA